MEITLTMMRAAREAELLHHQQAGVDRLKPLPDALMRAIIDAAISAIGEDDEPEPEPVQPPNVRIVRAAKPKMKPRPGR